LLAVLEQSKGINTISPTWFSVADNQGNITSLASEAYVSRAHNAGVEVWALCDDFNKEADINELLSYTSRREKLENELIASAFKFDLDGINIDFENITAKSAKHYIQFLRELSIKCRNNGIVLSVDNYVPASYNRFYDLEEQGKVVDYVAIMAYDEHHSNSEESGSVSSIGFFQKAIEDTLKEVGKERVIAGIPFYTRLWTEKADGSLTSAAYGMGAIRTLLEENGAKVNWDEETGQNYAEYKTADGVNKVWLEDEKSIERRMKTASEAGVAGMAYWKLGMEKANVWNTIQKFIN
jgi:spore germination protein YaaH